MRINSRAKVGQASEIVLVIEHGEMLPVLGTRSPIATKHKGRALPDTIL
jgi:hypothetical protein